MSLTGGSYGGVNFHLVYGTASSRTAYLSMLKATAVPDGVPLFIDLAGLGVDRNNGSVRVSASECSKELTRHVGVLGEPARAFIAGVQKELSEGLRDVMNKKYPLGATSDKKATYPFQSQRKHLSAFAYRSRTPLAPRELEQAISLDPDNAFWRRKCKAGFWFCHKHKIPIVFVLNDENGTWLTDTALFKPWNFHASDRTRAQRSVTHAELRSLFRLVKKIGDLPIVRFKEIHGQELRAVTAPWIAAPGPWHAYYGKTAHGQLKSASADETPVSSIGVLKQPGQS